MRESRSSCVVAATLAAGFLAYPGLTRSERAVSAEPIVPNERVAESVEVRNLVVDGGVVSGVVTNRSSKALRDVELLIRYEWLWKNEFRPGEDSPGRAIYYVLPGEVPPGGQMPFTYRADPPPPERADGRFDTSVQVVGFVELSG